MSEPWKSDKWFVSPWNYLSEVVGHLTFPQKVRIHDVTLRDGEQQAGVVFNKEEKIRIAEKLAEIGVHRIEAGMPAVSKQDAEAIGEIVRRDLGPQIFAFSRCMKQDIQRAVDCGVKGVVVEIPSSEHIIRHAYRWPLEKAIELAVEATSYAREQGLYTVFFPIDATRAEMTWFLNLIEKVATDGHMDALVLVDTFGGASPHAIPYFVKRVKERIKKPLEAHFHDDFGLAVANTLLAVASGVEVAHTTVTGLGERAGNAAYEELVLALLTMYGVDTGIDYRKLCEVSRLVRSIAGHQIPSNRPVVGEMLYNIESGIIATWFKNCAHEVPLELVPFHWDLVGQKPATVVLGKKSGLDSVRFWLEETGFSVPSETEVEEVLAKVKETAFAKHGLVTTEEFAEIASSVLGIRRSCSHS